MHEEITVYGGFFFEKIINVQVQISNFDITFMSNYYVKITSTSNKFSFDITISSNQVNFNVGNVLKKSAGCQNFGKK